MKIILEMIPVDDISPMPSYAFNWKECFLMAATGTLAMYIILTGLISLIIMLG